MRKSYPQMPIATGNLSFCAYANVFMQQRSRFSGRHWPENLPRRGFFVIGKGYRSLFGAFL